MGYKPSGLPAAEIAAIHAAQAAIHDRAMATVTDSSRSSSARGAAARAADKAHDKASKAYGSYDMGASGAAGGSYGGGATQG